MSVVLTSCACLYQVTGRSSVTSVASHSPRRETCCDTSSCTQAKNPSNAPSAATPAGGAMPSVGICALMLVRILLTLFSSLLYSSTSVAQKKLHLFHQKCFRDLGEKNQPITLLKLGQTFFILRHNTFYIGLHIQEECKRSLCIFT